MHTVNHAEPDLGLLCLNENAEDMPVSQSYTIQ